MRHAVRLFPALEGIGWSHRSNGRVALTADHYPHLHEPAEGIIAGLGYNGRGIAMATAMGRIIAERLGGASDSPPLPVTPIRPIRFHRLWPLVVAARRAHGALGDRLRGLA